MLKIWTSVKDDILLKGLYGPLLHNSGVPHKFSATLPTIEEGDLLFALGGPHVSYLQKEGYLPKARTIHSLRGTLRKYQEGHLMVSYSPALKNLSPDMAPEIEWDTQLAVRFAATGSLEPEVGTYTWVEDFSLVIDYVQKHKSKGPVYLSCDLETIGLDPFFEGDATCPPADIVSISFSTRPGNAYVIRTLDSLSSGVLDQINYLCTTKDVKLVGANLKFDAVWMLEKWGIRITNQTFDTFLVGSLLNENISNSLNLHAKMYTSMGGYDDAFNSTQDKSRMDLVPKDVLLPYAGGDTDACYRVMLKQREELVKDKALANFYIKQVQPVATAFANMEHRGVVVDIERYYELKKEVQTAMDELHSQAVAMFPRALRLKHRDNLSLTRGKILKEFFFTPHGLNLRPQMFTEKTREPATRREHFELYIDDPDAMAFVELYKRWGSAKKTMGTYIDGFLTHLRSDGRFHPTYYLGKGDEGGTNTGRSSAKNPAYQTLPKHTIWAKPLRTVYVPPPGYVILKADYSQGELRVTACVANEPTMIQSYKDGIDLHLKTGATLNGYSLSDAMDMMANSDKKIKDLIKKIRQGGKIGNFGLIYGMQPPGLVEYARTQYGVILTLEEAIKFREAFFSLYPGLVTWHASYINFAKANGYVRSPLGRIRHLPLINSKDFKSASQAERQAINGPIQGTLSDMTELAIAILYQEYPELWVFGFTHDEIQMYVPEEEILLWVERVREVMENLPFHEFGWRPQLNFVADYEASAVNLAECEELELSF